MRDNPQRHLLHVFPTFAVGGSQSRFGRLVQLHGSRYRHTVVSLDGECAMAQRLSGEENVNVIPGPDRSSAVAGGIAQALRFIDGCRPDVLVTYNWGSFDWWVAKRLRSALPHVHLEDGFGPDEITRQLYRRILARRLVLSDRKTTLVLPSRNLERIAKSVWRISHAQIRYIPNGVDCVRFTAGPQDNAEHRVVIGTVATLRPEKNLTRLIELFGKAAHRTPSLNLQLLIVGGGAEFDRLRQAADASAFADRIVLAGPTTSPETFLAKMDIFSLTSDTEQMPLSVIEAMASGLPVVSFGVGDVPTMVSAPNKTAASVPLDDDEEFIQNLLTLAESAPLRHTLGAANRETALTQFDERVMAAAYIHVFG